MKTRGLILVLIVLTACLSQPTGTLQGHVSMTMEAAVQPGAVPPTPAPEAYARRQVVVYTANGKQVVNRVQIDEQGNYQVSLPDGTYQVDINHEGVDWGIDLPASVTIVAGQITRLDIMIDTGVR